MTCAWLGWIPNMYVSAAALPRAVTERGVLETWDVQSAEEIPVASVLLNTQVRTISVPQCSPYGVLMQLDLSLMKQKGVPYTLLACIFAWQQSGVHCCPI